MVNHHFPIIFSVTGLLRVGDVESAVLENELLGGRDLQGPKMVSKWRYSWLDDFMGNRKIEWMISGWPHFRKPSQNQTKLFGGRPGVVVESCWGIGAYEHSDIHTVCHHI